MVQGNVYEGKDNKIIECKKEVIIKNFCKKTLLVYISTLRIEENSDKISIKIEGRDKYKKFTFILPYEDFVIDWAEKVIRGEECKKNSLKRIFNSIKDSFSFKDNSAIFLEEENRIKIDQENKKISAIKEVKKIQDTDIRQLSSDISYIEDSINSY